MESFRALNRILEGPPEEAAPRLLGTHLVSEIDDKAVRVRITEVEAYKGVAKKTLPTSNRAAEFAP